MKSPNVRVTNWNEANIGGSPNNIITGIETEDVLNVNVVGTVNPTEPTEKVNYEPILPKTIPVPFEKINASGTKIRHLTKDGVLYGAKTADSRLHKSADFGETWVPLATTPPEVAAQVHKFTDGKLLVIARNGKTYLSDEAEENFALVYDFNTSIGEAFGMDVYGDMVFISSYAGNNYDRCYMSFDQGATWKQILQHPDPSISHFHDIAYDPYENIVWACSGDYGVKDNVFYSNDFGNTWETTYGIPDLNVRSTAIIPLPKCVLFVSDTNGSMFVWRYDRHPEGTQGHQVIPYKAWFHKRNIPLDKSDFVGSKPAITYGAESSALFGWHAYNPGGNVTPAVVIATKDGYSFTTIWTSGELMDPSNTNYVDGGLMGVFGPTDTNEYVAYYTKGDKDNLTAVPSRYAVKINFPGWG